MRKNVNFFKAHKDLRLILRYKELVIRLWEFESEAEKKIWRGSSEPWIHQKKIQAVSNIKPGYKEIRQELSKIVNDVARIPYRYGVPIVLTSFPAPAVGGPIVETNIFTSVLHDDSHTKIDKQIVFDKINEVIGACEREIRKGFLRLINPFYWIKSLFVFVIRLPFIVLQTSGFNIDKLEDHFISKLFKLIMFLVIIVVLLIIGFTNKELKEIIIKFFRG